MTAPREIAEGAAPSRAYGLAWTLLARWLHVPRDPPPIPPGRHRWARSFRPAEGYLRYLKVHYGLLVLVLGLSVGALIGALALALFRDGNVVAGVGSLLLLGGPLLLWAVAGYFAIQLRFDTTWYVLTDRALRLRSGIWVIREVTISLENVQNMRVRQGPIQRWLGVGDVTVETAAAGSTDPQTGASTANKAVIAGVSDPHGIRDRIIERMRASRSAGLGEAEGEAGPGSVPGAVRGATGTTSSGSVGSPELLQVLREIRAEVARLD